MCGLQCVVKVPLEFWQTKNWDPAVGSTVFDDFCTALNKPPAGILTNITDLPFNHIRRMVQVSPEFSVDFSIFNYAKWIKEVIAPLALFLATREGNITASRFNVYN